MVKHFVVSLFTVVIIIVIKSHLAVIIFAIVGCGVKIIIMSKWHFKEFIIIKPIILGFNFDILLVEAINTQLFAELVTILKNCLEFVKALVVIEKGIDKFI